MKIIKFLLGIVAIAIIPLCTIVMADDCFDTIVDNNGKVFYIDPIDGHSFFEDKKILISKYGEKIKCSEEKKVYSQEEYISKIYSDLNKQKQVQQGTSSSTSAFMELVMLILSFVAMRKIFVKAGKSGVHSIIPIYNFYVLSDIAGVSGLFSKAFTCFIIGILIYIFIPTLGLLLVLIFVIYGFIVNFYVARNFGWSTVASILYVIFNPIAMLILAFGNDKYYPVEQAKKMKEISRKAQIDETIVNEYTGDSDLTTELVEETPNNNTSLENKSETDDPIKYIDSSNFA